MTDNARRECGTDFEMILKERMGGILGGGVVVDAALYLCLCLGGGWRS